MVENTHFVCPACGNPKQSGHAPECTSQSENERRHEFSIPAQKREIVPEGGAKDYTYIVSLTEAVERALHLPETIELPEGVFVRKEEFHATALGFKAVPRVKEAVKRLAEEGRNAIQEINQALSDTDFSFDLDLSTVKLVRNLDYDADATREGSSFESERTIVVDINMPGMANFYNRLREIGIDLDKPATHITLYIAENGDATGLGIGITNLEKQLAGETAPHIEVQPVSAEKLGIVRTL